MYAVPVRFACCLLVSHVEYASCVLLRLGKDAARPINVRKQMGRTDGHQTDTRRSLLDAANVIMLTGLFGSKSLAICAQAVYFLHSTRPSVMWHNSRWWLAACDLVMSALSDMLSTRVGRRRKYGEVSCTCHWNDFELIPTVKMETRNPAGVDGYFGREYLAICNHCGVMAAWSRMLIFFEEIFPFFYEKRPLTIKFSKFCSIATQIDVLCSNFAKFGRQEIGEIVCCLPDKKFAWLSSCGYCADCAQNLPRQCTQSGAPDFIQIGSLSVGYAERVDTAKTRRKVNPIFGWSLASSRIIIISPQLLKAQQILSKVADGRYLFFTFKIVVCPLRFKLLQRNLAGWHSGPLWSLNPIGVWRFKVLKIQDGGRPLFKS